MWIVLTLCFSEKLPAAGNLAFILEGNDLIWNAQCFPPQIQRAGLTTVYTVLIHWETALERTLSMHVMSSSVTSRVQKASFQYGELSSIQVYNCGHTMASSWAQLSLPYRTLAFSICEVTEELITRWVILSKQSYNGLKLFLEEHSYFHIYVPAISRDISSVFLLLQLFCLNLRCIEVRIQFQK